MGKRGAALPTVLALVTVVLIAGLAMGSLSTISLQFHRRHTDSLKAEMAARSLLSHLLADIRAHESKAEEELSPLDPKPFDIAKIFPDGLEHRGEGYRAYIYFDPDQGPEYSSDNLAADAPKLGSLDVDGKERIPPFGLDLVILVDGPSSHQRYRATLRRAWPFAVYAKHGSMVFMGQPDLSGSGPGFPSKIQGKVYTEWESLTDYGDQVKGYGLGLMNDPDKILENIEAREGYQPRLLPYHPLIVGMDGVVNPPVQPRDQKFLPDTDEPLQTLYSYHEPDWPLEWGQTERFVAEQGVFRSHRTDMSGLLDTGNVVDGDFFYDHELDVAIGPSVVKGSGPLGPNEFNGEIHLTRAPLRDPLESLKEPDFKAFPKLTMLPPDDTLMDFVRALNGGSIDADALEINDNSGSEPFLLTETLKLNEDSSPHYLIEGSVSNRQSFYDKTEKKLYVRETFAGLELQGVTLVVDGDLDLGASALGRAIPISGAGSTLIVKGQLTLGNAHINAGDQGFVLYADDIVLKGGGNFFGLMIARNSITVLSQDKDPLRIEGGVMCAGRGGITLRGAEVKHEPRYLKGVNGGGEFFVEAWQKL